MESNLILTNIVTIVVFFITVGYYKSKVDGIEKDNQSQGEEINQLRLKMEQQGETISILKTRSELAVTAKEVDEKYTSKELFRQFEDHMKTRFDGVENGLREILTYIKKA